MVDMMDREIALKELNKYQIKYNELMEEVVRAVKAKDDAYDEVEERQFMLQQELVKDGLLLLHDETTVGWMVVKI